MSNELFGLLFFLILESLPVSLLVIFIVYRKYFVTTHYYAALSPSLFELYTAQMINDLRDK